MSKFIETEGFNLYKDLPDGSVEVYFTHFNGPPIKKIFTDKEDFLENQAKYREEALNEFEK